MQGTADYLSGNPTEPIQRRARRDPQACYRGYCPENHFHKFRHLDTAREYINYLVTERFDKPPRPQTGETPRGRIEEAAAAAQEPGTMTTNHRTGGVSLATPASGPRHHHAFVKPTTPQESASTVTLQRLPCDTKSHRAADVERGGEADNEAGQKPETETQQADDAAADIANPHATCAEPTAPVGTSQNPPDQSEPLSRVSETVQRRPAALERGTERSTRARGEARYISRTSPLKTQTMPRPLGTKTTSRHHDNGSSENVGGPCRRDRRR